MNAADVEDRAYLAGLPQSTAQPTGEETWFGVFLRVQNTTDKTIAPANDFEIVDTQENVYRPIPIDTNVNPFAYKPDPIAPQEPDPGAGLRRLHGDDPGLAAAVQGQDRVAAEPPARVPLQAGRGTTGVVDLDV